MEQTALENDLEITLPPLLSTIIENLKQDGIYCDPNSVQEKKSLRMDQKAVEAMHEAIRHATDLLGGSLDLAQAARLLEKIQVAAAVAEKTAFITHTKRAERCSEAVHRIAHECRSYFHEMKASRRLLRKN